MNIHFTEYSVKPIICVWEEAEDEDEEGDRMARKFSELRSKMSPDARARVDARVITALAQLPLLELRKARNLSQEKLAQALETTQGEISKIEHRTDLYLSTLRNYIEAMGGELDIIARFKDGAVRISTFQGVNERDLPA
jgi:DNA-binding transcriptional regulator YiaG